MSKRSSAGVVVALPGLEDNVPSDPFIGFVKAKVLVNRETFRAIPWSPMVEYELYYQGWVPWYGYVDVNGQPVAFDEQAGSWLDPLPETVQRVHDAPKAL